MGKLIYVTIKKKKKGKSLVQTKACFFFFYYRFQFGIRAKKKKDAREDSVTPKNRVFFLLFTFLVIPISTYSADGHYVPLFVVHFFVHSHSTYSADGLYVPPFFVCWLFVHQVTIFCSFLQYFFTKVFPFFLLSISLVFVLSLVFVSLSLVFVLSLFFVSLYCFC